MSRAACADSLPDDIQLTQTNSSRRDSSSINNEISHRENHLIQFSNERIPIDNKSIHRNKQDNTNPHKRYSKRSMYFFI